MANRLRKIQNPKSSLWVNEKAWYRLSGFVCDALTCLPLQYWKHKESHTGKSFSEAFIFASTNPQCDKLLFIELQVQYMKIESSEHVVNKNCSECEKKNQLVYTTCSEHVLSMFWACSELASFMYWTHNIMNNLSSYYIVG